MSPPGATDRGAARFAGFPEGLGLLPEIGGATKEEFAALKPTWDRTLLDPARELVEVLGDRLRAEVSPTIASSPKVNGSLSPITRDLRFAPKGSLPYKDHLLLNFWDGPTKRTAPTLRVRIAADGVGFGAGAGFDAAALKAWRAATSGDAGDDLLRILADLGARLDGTSLDLSEPELKKVPAGHDPGRAAADLLRHKSFQARFLRPAPHDATSPDLASRIGDDLVLLAPVHLWLKEHLA